MLYIKLFYQNLDESIVKFLKSYAIYFFSRCPMCRTNIVCWTTNKLVQLTLDEQEEEKKAVALVERFRQQEEVFVVELRQQENNFMEERRIQEEVFLIEQRQHEHVYLQDKRQQEEAFLFEQGQQEQVYMEDQRQQEDIFRYERRQQQQIFIKIRKQHDQVDIEEVRQLEEAFLEEFKEEDVYLQDQKHNETFISEQRQQKQAYLEEQKKQEEIFLYEQSQQEQVYMKNQRQEQQVYADQRRQRLVVYKIKQKQLVNADLEEWREKDHVCCKYQSRSNDIFFELCRFDSSENFLNCVRCLHDIKSELSFAAILLILKSNLTICTCDEHFGKFIQNSKVCDIISSLELLECTNWYILCKIIKDSLKMCPPRDAFQELLFNCFHSIKSAVEKIALAAADKFPHSRKKLYDLRLVVVALINKMLEEITL